MDGSKKLFLFFCLQLSIYMVDVAAVAPIELLAADVTKVAPIQLQAVAADGLSDTDKWTFIFGKDSPNYDHLFDVNGLIYSPYDPKQPTVVYIVADGKVYYVKIEVYSKTKPSVNLYDNGKVEIAIDKNEEYNPVKYTISAKGTKNKANK